MSSQKIKIFAIAGSTRKNSSNFKILKYISEKINPQFEIEIFEEIDQLPHFNPDLDQEIPPQKVTEFRNKIIQADGILICTPEYVFSLPGTLKNAFEWCVSSTVFSGKNTGLITASASGEMGHEQLLLIMKTVEAKLNNDAQLLIQGIRGKIDDEGKITNPDTEKALESFITNFGNQFLNEL